MSGPMLGPLGSQSGTLDSSAGNSGRRAGHHSVREGARQLREVATAPGAERRVPPATDIRHWAATHQAAQIDRCSHGAQSYLMFRCTRDVLHTSPEPV